ncbi:hypothetical protein HYV57_03390 [Candidatus Peregrinibacteria bacterium]|nr:hypothetical protein [Candidatus Peregrinibacteria bacterium]
MPLSYSKSPDRPDDPSCSDRASFFPSSFLRACRIFVASAILGLISPNQASAMDVSSRQASATDVSPRVGFSQIAPQPFSSYAILQKNNPAPINSCPSDFPFALSLGATGTPDFRSAPLMELTDGAEQKPSLCAIMNKGIFNPSAPDLQHDLDLQGEDLKRSSVNSDFSFVSGALALNVRDVSSHSAFLSSKAFHSRLGLRAHVTFPNNSIDRDRHSGDHPSASSLINMQPSSLEVNATATLFHRILSSFLNRNVDVKIGTEVCLTCPESDVGIGVSFLLNE